MPKVIHICLHAKKQLKERKIQEELVKEILLHPGQVINSYRERKIAQDVIKYKGENFLFRVVYEQNGKEFKVITVYLTTKIKKYWR